MLIGREIIQIKSGPGKPHKMLQIMHYARKTATFDKNELCHPPPLSILRINSCTFTYTRTTHKLNRLFRMRNRIVDFYTKFFLY